MKTKKTIRNCLPLFRLECPKRWEELTEEGGSGVRHCEKCDRDVFYCMTDEETIAHAKAGHCIAREMPHETEMPLIRIGKPTNLAPIELTPRQEEAVRWTRREHGVDDSIGN